MKRSGSPIRWQVALLGAQLGVLAAACGGPAPDAEDAPSQGGSNAGASSVGNRPTGAGSRTGTRNGSAGGSATSVDPTVTLPGVDPPLDTPPAGCTRGVRSGALQLELTAQMPSVELRADAGTLLANGQPCSDAGGVELGLSQLLSLQISGGSEDNAVILDLGSGDWSTLLGSTESVQLALGEGENDLLVRGSAGDDHYRHALRDGDLVLDLLGDGSIQVVASGVTELGFSLGDGDDRLEDLAALLAAADPLAEPELTALELPLVVSGGAGNDWLVGGAGDDELDGGPGDDVASGLDGSDRFQAEAETDGRDIWNGGPGYDEVSYELRSDDLDLSLCRSAALLGCAEGECVCEARSGAGDEGDQIVNVEELRAGAGDDILHGSDVSESLRGGAGNDSLFGLGGSDLLAGERGIDLLEGGTDGDICDGQSDETMIGCEL